MDPQGRTATPVSTVNRQQVTQPPPDAPPWWQLLQKHTAYAPGTSPELLEMQLADLPDGTPEATVKAKKRELAIARLNRRYPQVDLKAVLAHTNPVPGTGKLPILALYPIGGRHTNSRSCVIQTQQMAKRGSVREVRFTSTPALMAETADLTAAFTGREEGTGYQVIWTSTLTGTLPPKVAMVLASLGLLEGEGNEGSGGGTEVTIGGTTTGLPDGATGVLVGPSAFGFHTTDPGVLIVVRDGNRVKAWLHDNGRDDSIGRFDMETGK